MIVNTDRTCHNLFYLEHLYQNYCLVKKRKSFTRKFNFFALKYKYLESAKRDEALSIMENRKEIICFWAMRHLSIEFIESKKNYNTGI
jgi:hypothetical protein